MHTIMQLFIMFTTHDNLHSITKDYGTSYRYTSMCLGECESDGCRFKASHGIFSPFSNFSNIPSLNRLQDRSPTDLQHLCCKALIGSSRGT